MPKLKRKRLLSLYLYALKALPPGKYLLFESYCGDSDCDCRKVMINLVSKELKKIVATVGFGWENKAFYTNWTHGDAELGKKLAGAYLEPGCIQSQYSDTCLELLKSIIVNDHKYIDTIKQHYKAFMEELAKGNREYVHNIHNSQ